MARIRLDLLYDGAPFHGWAVQPGLPSVQGALQTALSLVLRVPITLTVAGRTDAGVHATGQVAHFDWLSGEDTEPILQSSRRDFSGFLTGDATGKKLFLSRLDAALHVVLSGNTPVVPGMDFGRAVTYPVSAPGAVIVADATVVPDEFDARFSALGRHYEYRITDEVSARNPLTRGTRWWYNTPGTALLDIAAMQEAALCLLGEHDFAAFCKPREGASTIRTLTGLKVIRDGLGEVLVEVSADAFCHSMVRALIGALTEVGRHKQSPSWIVAALSSSRRLPEIPIAPPHGLTLVRVDYPPLEANALQQRQIQTRQRRRPFEV